MSAETFDKHIEKKSIIWGIPIIFSLIILLSTLLLQEYQMGKENSFWRGSILPILTVIMIIGYFVIPILLSRKGLQQWRIYIEGLIIYIVALAELIYFIIAYSMGGLATPEFTFSHFFFLIPYVFFTMIYFARMYSPKRTIPLVMKKRIIFALLILTFLGQWITIPQLLQPQIQRRFESQLEEKFGVNYETLINPLSRDTFGNGLFHVDEFFSDIDYPHNRTENLVVYNYSNYQLIMHWYTPLGLQANETRPGILSIHGGGFISGHAYDLDQETLCEWWVSRGYVAGTLEYRLSPDFRFPAAIEDIRRTLVYLKENATALHLDINRTAMIGRSAGATLMINSLSQNEWLYNNTGRINKTEMVPIKALIAMYPVVNFVQLMAEESGRFYNLIYRYGPYKNYFGFSYKDNPELYEIAAPANALYPDFPPMLIIGGGLDTLTPKNSHFDMFLDSCDEVGNDVIPLQIPWANHAFDELLTSKSGVLCTFAWERFMGNHMWV